MSSPNRSNYGRKVVKGTVQLHMRKHVGMEIVFDNAAGATAKLPRATGSGETLSFSVLTAISSGSYQIVCTGSDKFVGQIACLTDNSANVVGYAANGTTHVRILLDGSTQGGEPGDWIEVTDIAAGKWRVKAMLAASGSEATPFEVAA